MNLNDILDLIPQRYPFIFIDKVTHLEPNKKIIAVKNVTLNEPYFNGHFPGKPIMPGVLILEALAQASIILAKKSVDSYDKSSLYVFAGIDKVRFRKMVIPGDQLELHVEFVKMRQAIWKMNGEARVGDEVVCSAEMTSATKDVEL